MQDEGSRPQSSRPTSTPLRLLPDLDLRADDIAISSSGTFAAICGTHRAVSAAFCTPCCSSRLHVRDIRST